MATDKQLSPHFNTSEFRCHHCGKLHSQGVNYPLVVMLEHLRGYFGDKPVTVQSGYRCTTHNANVGGASNSRHTYGDAADIVIEGVKPSMVYSYLNKWHQGGLGKYGTFTHVDMRGVSARWTG